MNPTKEQEQWFWEQCGFREKFAYHDFYYLVAPDGSIIDTFLPQYGTNKYPPIDLNNLFKYAVPKLYDREVFCEVGNIFIVDESGRHNGIYAETHEWVKEIYEKRKRKRVLAYVSMKGNDPALALFWAIYKALGGEE